MMSMRRTTLSLAVLVACATGAFAQPSTPTPVDSNIAVTSYAQNHGLYAVGTPSPCTVRGGNGCGGCYPASIPGSDPTSELPKVDPEWSGIGTMITSGGDASVPPLSQPVLLQGTVALSKINVGGDFPGSHITDDQNTFITPDPAFNGFLATGNSATPSSCPGEGCDQVEMEIETGKYPLFAWAGEGDHVTALGRWIFDCGHPNPNPGHCSVHNLQTCISNSDCPTPETCVGGVGGCTGSGSRCIIDSECGVCNTGTSTCTQTSNAASSCSSNSDCGTCTNPAANFNYRAEMHPPQAIAVVRNKSIKTAPATQADVYVSADGGGAGDLCTVSHLATASSVLFAKACFNNHCSVTTDRSCKVDKDCAGTEKCIVFASTTDTTQLVADVNAQNFEFDMPLPPPPPAATPQIVTKSFKPSGGLMPKPTFQVTFGPTPNLHVIIPMATPLPSGKLPNVFAERITAGWKKNPTTLTHVQVKFTQLTVNNPLKDRVSAMPRQCLMPFGGLSNLKCNVDTDCPAGQCATSHTDCWSDAQCGKKDSCSSGSRCVGGVTPGWNVFGQVNGDWVHFTKLDTIGAKAPFAAPPYFIPSPTPLVIPEKFTFNEYVPSDGSIHVATTGQSLNCLDTLYGANLKDALNNYGLTLGGACLDAGDNDPGRVDVTHNGPNFVAAPPNGLCTAAGAPFTCCTGSGTGTCLLNDACTGVGTPFACCTGSATGTCPLVTCLPPTKPGGPTICTVTSGTGDGGTCSVTTNKLCTTAADCPGTCSVAPAGPCLTASDCQHCSITSATPCATNFDCPAGTCNNNPAKYCHTNADCGTGHTCTTTPVPPETCVPSVGAACNNVETCSGTGGGFTLQYTVQVK